MGQRTDPAVSHECFVQGRACVRDFGPEQGQLDAISQHRGGLEQIRQPLSLAQRSGEEDAQRPTNPALLGRCRSDGCAIRNDMNS